MATRKTVKGTGKAKWADAAGGETTIKPGKAGVLGRMLPDFPIPQLKTSPDETPIPKPAPRVFFADDDRMKWAIYYVSGGAERAAGRINSWIIGGHLPLDFELDDLLALARRGAPGVSQAFFTPRAISEASRDINALDGDGKVQQANTQTTGRPGKKPGPSPDVSHGFYSIADLARRNNIPDYKRDAFEKYLRRWRKDNELSSDFISHDAATKNQARFLFRESAGAIQDIIKRYSEKG